jgi:hypothetical protein
MKTRIYLGEDVVVGTNQINRYKIEFSGNPGNSTRIAFDIKKNGAIVENVDKTFNANTSDILLTITGNTPTITAQNLLDNLQSYNTNSITTYELATESNSYGNLDIYINVVGDIADVFTFTSLSNTTGGKVTLINVGQISTYDETEIAYSLLDLYEDENIEVTSKLSDIEKLSNVFTDFSNSFSVPATANNSELFKHYYDVDIDNTFNANIRVNGYIEIDSFPFRFGKIQLESIKLKNQRPDTYKITFYGAVIQLTDLFGDDTIDRLDYDRTIVNNRDVFTKVRGVLSQFDYEYNSNNFADSIDSPSFKDGNVITPLISYTNRDWNYGSANALDISTDAGAILDSELRPALRIYNIINAIEAKYNISFTRNFFGSAQFNNLFIWLNQQTEGILGRKEDVLITTPLSGTPDAGNVQLVDGYIYITRQRYSPAGAIEYIARVDYDVTPTNSSIVYNAYLIDENGSTVKQWLNVSGTQSFAKEWKSEFRLNANESITLTEQVKLVIQSTQSLDFTVDLNVNYKRDVAGMIDIYTDLYSLNNSNIINVSVFMQDNLPKMKVIDFFQGIMKMFKLIIRPLSNNQFYVNTLDGYYSDGNVLNITEYVNQEEVTIERPLIYKDISFKFQKTNNVAGEKFRETNDPVNNDIGYGDLKVRYTSIDSKDELKVELPFENMLFERMTVLQPAANAGAITNLSIGQSISTSDDITFSPNNSKPILFYNNGSSNNVNFPIKIKFLNTIGTFSSPYIIGNTNDELLDQVTDAINFNSEIDPWHETTIANSLYLNYWSNWIETIYDLKQRKFTYEGYLPPRFIEELSLNDRLLIGNNRYKINDYKINLLDGKTQLTLFNDIYDWNPYSFPSDFIHNERSFAPNGWYTTDTIDNGDSAYIYGSFTSYDGTNYGRIVKYLANGDIDTTFNTGTGFNSNLYGFQSIVKQDDGKILATGDFTSFNGTARNRIVRINTDGSLDSTFNYGFGFNNLTSGIAIDSEDKIVVCGSFSNYSGITSSRIARIQSNGFIDIPFTLAIGSAFNNVTNSVVINSDNSMYIGGYFSSFDGTSSNRLIKLTSGGTVDTSFNIGTGLNSGVPEPVGLIADINDGVYAYGYFTTYSGISANRLVRLLPNGQINPQWFIGTGFNSYIFNTEKVLGDKLLVRGVFTSFNGLAISNGLIVLNADGTVYRTFNGSYVNVFAIGNRFYGNLANGVTELIGDETLPILAPETIIANAGTKFYGINILKNEAWSVSKVDLGYGTDWIDITTTSDTGAGECVIRIEQKAEQTPPTVYQPRYMTLRFNFSGVYRDVLIIQNGLEQ